MSLRPRAQDLFQSLGYAVSFVIRKSEHGKVGGKGVHTGYLTFRIKHSVQFILPDFSFPFSHSNYLSYSTPITDLSRWQKLHTE